MTLVAEFAKNFGVAKETIAPCESLGDFRYSYPLHHALAPAHGG